MNALTPALPILPGSAAPNAVASAAPASEGEPAFADALEQARQPRSDQGARSGRTDRTDRGERSGRAREAHAADTRHAARPAAAEAGPAKPTAGDAVADAAGDAATGDPADPALPAPAETALPPWLEAALTRSPKAEAATARSVNDAATPALRGRDAASSARQAALPAGAAPGAGAQPTADGPDTSRPRPEPAAEGLVFAQALQLVAGDAPRAAGLDAAAQAPAMASTVAASPTGAGAAPGASAAVQAPETRDITAPLHGPEFAPALGAQINLLIKDGVTEARLHLNPAEMGPITVQIQIEGQTARVEMAAEQAVTRQVLEQSMPVLAGALRDSGLTLTGGGVFEQAARDPRQGEAGAAPGSPSRAADGTGGDPDAGAERRPVAVPQGMVDLYA